MDVMKQVHLKQFKDLKRVHWTFRLFSAFQSFPKTICNFCSIRCTWNKNKYYTDRFYFFIGGFTPSCVQNLLLALRPVITPIVLRETYVVLRIKPGTVPWQAKDFSAVQAYLTPVYSLSREKKFSKIKKSNVICAFPPLFSYTKCFQFWVQIGITSKKISECSL